jgi:dipeptidyl aminopeptidase/acylaminoacyl peptidase
MRPDGSRLTPIFGGPILGAAGVPEGVTYYRQPHFGYQSPDGKYFLDWAVDQSTSGEKILSAVKMLHLGHLDGGTTQIIAAEDVTECFAWAPDSKRFVYETTNQVRSITGRMIYTPKQVIIRTIDKESDLGSELVLEKPNTWAVQDWSPDGEKLLFTSGLGIGKTASDTETNTSLIEFDLERARQMRMKLPGGGFFLDERSLKDLDSNLRTIKATKGKTRLLGGRYSPSGKDIVSAEYLVQDNEYKRSELMLIEAATGATRRIITYPESLRGPFCWSPDGEEILFSRHLPEYDAPEKSKNGLGIWAIRPDGSEARFITTGWCADWR